MTSLSRRQNCIALLSGMLLIGPIFGALLTARSFISFFDPRTYAGMNFFLGLIPALAAYSVITWRLLQRRVEHPLPVVVRFTRRQRWWFIRSFLLLNLIAGSALAFPLVKDQLPHFVPFYADPWLIAADRFVFFGHDPWRLTHAVFGPRATQVIDRAYMLYFPLMGYQTLWLCVTRDRNFQLRGLLTLVATWIFLGVLCAYALASVGPVFYQYYYSDPYFQPLTERLSAIDAEYPLYVQSISQWLLASVSEGAFGAGISAMPSMHVALCWLFFLLVRDQFKLPFFRWSAFAYFMVIWIGSVHLAWHYAVDGAFSIAGVSLLWWVSGKLVYGKEAVEGLAGNSRSRDFANTVIAQGVATGRCKASMKGAA